MNESIQEKAIILTDVIKVNNIALVSKLNNAQNNMNLTAEVDIQAKLMASALLGVNLLDGNFAGIENMLNDNEGTIKFLRECSKDELLHELRSASDAIGVKNAITNLDANMIFEHFMEQKKNNEINISNNGVSNSYEKENIINKKSSYGFRESENNFISKNENPSQYKNINKSNYQYEQRDNLNQNIYNEKKDLVSMCGNSLDCSINGIRVMITPQEDGSYSINENELYTQSMEITFNHGKDKQWVNKQTLTKEEFQQFLEEYESEIFGIQKQHQNSYEMESHVGYDGYDNEGYYSPY